MEVAPSPCSIARRALVAHVKHNWLGAPSPAFARTYTVGPHEAEPMMSAGHPLQGHPVLLKLLEPGEEIEHATTAGEAILAVTTRRIAVVDQERTALDIQSTGCGVSSSTSRRLAPPRWCSYPSLRMTILRSSPSSPKNTRLSRPRSLRSVSDSLHAARTRGRSASVGIGGRPAAMDHGLTPD